MQLVMVAHVALVYIQVPDAAAYLIQHVPIHFGLRFRQYQNAKSTSQTLAPQATVQQMVATEFR